MKKLLLFTIVLCLSFYCRAQFSRAKIPGELKKIALLSRTSKGEAFEIKKSQNPYVKSALSDEEFELGITYYDLPSNASTANRIYYHEDGTIGAVWMYGTTPTAFPERGTAYAYFDGVQWNTSSERIESVRTGWPTYAPLGTGGEIVVSHKGPTLPLDIVTRTTKGTGDWTENELAPPVGTAGLFWPRMVTSGTNHDKIHIFTMTTPTANGGTPYLGQDGALLYSRSSDNGLSWEVSNRLLPELDSSHYVKFSADAYNWAEPRGNTLAFVVGSNWTDMFLLKSTDGGDTWTKTLIFEHPYPMWNGTVTDTFYCADGSLHPVIDNNGMVRVAFGITRAVTDETGSWWFPFVDGIGYWDETMPAYSGLEGLNPDSLYAHGRLLAWAPDLNGNGTWDILSGSDVLGNYSLSVTSMPQLICGDYNELYLVFSTVMEGYDNGTQNYRHVLARSSNVGGTIWGDFVDLTNDITHLFDECVYPTVAANFDNDLHLYFQTDDEPGLAVSGDEDPYGENRITYMTTHLQTGIEEQNLPLTSETISPNPASDNTTLYVNLKTPCRLSYNILTSDGNTVKYFDLGNVSAGNNMFSLNLQGLSSGFYFLQLQAGNQAKTKKLIIVR
ncbi:MAG: T9SS type A sorting domain-containing protein [Lentimicrobiaceae bacterium]|nr:T9SS type A sorting domain-containing protein [Lentimicrobiaceae bacterium]